MRDAVDIAAWLRGLGLERYEDAFRQNEIDAEILPKLTADDLKDIGVTIVGHRRKLFEAMVALAEPALAPQAEPSAPAETPATVQPGQAERRQLTVLFCDLVGSTELSAQLDPEDLGQVIRAYHGACSEVVERWGGHVAKYMGDGVLAYFGWPQAHEDEAERAVRAGLDLVAAVAGLATPDDASLAARVGIATGRVVVGELIGAGTAQEEAVIGETPNLAARLQALADPGSVVISQATRQLVGGLFGLADLGPRRLKGFAEPLAAFRVVGAGRAEGRFEALHGERLTPLVGREHELGILLERWEWAKDGEGQIVLLSGEPGIGKSRLTRSLIERLANEPHTCLRYYCSPHHINSALHPVIEQMERAAGFVADDRPASRLDKLEALLDQGTNDPLEVTPLFAALLSIPQGTRYPPLELPPQRQRELTIAAIVDEVRGLAARRPVLIVLEDAHWIDPTTTELFERLIERAQTLPVLLLVTFRSEFAPPWTSQPHMTLLTLSRLGRRHSTEMIAAVAGGKRLPEEVLVQIWAKTEGVPLFVEELTKTVLESGLLEDQGDRYALTTPLLPLAIPATLQASLMARLDRLASVKQVAQIGAVIGREFSYRLLATLSPLDESALQEALSHMVGSELVFRRGSIPDATYCFKHAFVRDAAYESLLRNKRQQLHADLANALRKRFPELAESQPGILAHHLTEAGLAAEAITYWQRAGQLAAERSANAEAAAHFRRSLELLRTSPNTIKRHKHELDLLTALGSMVISTKGHGDPEVRSIYTRARDLCEMVGDTPNLAPVLQGMRIYHLLRAELAPAREAARRLLALGESTGEGAYLVEAHRALGMVHFYAGEFEASRDHFERGIALYDIRAHGTHALRYEQDPGMTCLAHEAGVLWVLGFPDRALNPADRALAVAQATSHAASVVAAITWKALIALWRGDLQSAQQWAWAALELATEHGLPLWVGTTTVMHGRALCGAGQNADGLAEIREGLAKLAAAGDKLVRFYGLATLAEALGSNGQAEEGLAALDEAIASSSVEGLSYWGSELQRLKGDLILVKFGSGPAAEACFRQAIEIAQGQSAKSFELRAATSLARLWRDQGRSAEARDLLAPIYGWFIEGFDTADLTNAKALLDDLA